MHAEMIITTEVLVQAQGNVRAGGREKSVSRLKEREPILQQHVANEIQKVLRQITREPRSPGTIQWSRVELEYLALTCIEAMRLAQVQLWEASLGGTPLERFNQLMSLDDDPPTAASE